MSNIGDLFDPDIIPSITPFNVEKLREKTKPKKLYLEPIVDHMISTKKTIDCVSTLKEKKDYDPLSKKIWMNL